MKPKMRKKFLLADHAMELYEKFHSLKQNSVFMEECTCEFNNLSIRVGLNDGDKQVTSLYFVRLNQSIQDEMEYFVSNIDDAR